MKRRRSLALGLMLVLSGLSGGCATNNLLRWSRWEKSHYQRPDLGDAPYVVPGGTVAAFPFALVWDVLTFPFQLIWRIHPFGPRMNPDETETGPIK